MIGDYMKKELKMQWMVDKLLSPNYEYRIHNTNKNFGHIVMPTGTGKSGVCIEDIIYHIRNHKDGTLIINISCPILKLTQQLMNDVFEVIKGLKIDTSEIRFFVNSSDDGGNYSVADLEMDTNKLSEFAVKFNKINIIASCNKSLYKYISMIELLKENTKSKFNIINYLDESHLLRLKYDTTDENGNILDKEERVDLKRMCELSSSVYMFSATPDASMNKLVKGFDKPYESRYILEESAIEAIRKNEIIPPHLEIMKTSNVDITVERALLVLEKSKQLLPNIHHKILITARSRPHLDKLYKDLTAVSDNKFRVFAICSADETEKYDDYFVSDIKKFSDEIENYDGDCFVIHVQMLIQGIDIKGLTDCVIATANHGNVEFHRTIIQTIGRVLRCASGERGKPIEERSKKFGGAWFIIPDNDINTDSGDTQTSMEKRLRGLIDRYYGFNSLTFEKRENNTPMDGNGWVSVNGNNTDIFESPSDENPEFEVLSVDLCRIIESRFGPYLKRKGVNTTLLNSQILYVKDNYMKEYNKEFSTEEWLSNKEFTEIVYKKMYKSLKDSLNLTEDELNRIL